MSQVELPLQITRDMVMVDRSLIEAKSSLLSAWNLCIALAVDGESDDRRELQDKQIYSAVSLDKGHWSRIKDGQAHLAANLYNPLMQTCGNYAPLQWWAWSNGFGLTRLQSAVEMELAETKRELEDERLKTRVLTEAIRTRAA